MQMRPEVQLKSVIKALGDVVMPAVDADNKLAQEQCKLAIGLLSLLSQQLPMQHAFDCDELKRLIVYADELGGAASGGTGTAQAADALVAARVRASTALDGARTSPAQLQQAVRELRAASGELITQAHADGNPDCRPQLQKLTLAMSKEQLIRDRSMLLMQGWEPDPDAVPALSELL